MGYTENLNPSTYTNTQADKVGGMICCGCTTKTQIDMKRYLWYDESKNKRTKIIHWENEINLKGKI